MISSVAGLTMFGVVVLAVWNGTVKQNLRYLTQIRRMMTIPLTLEQETIQLAHRHRKGVKMRTWRHWRLYQLQTLRKLSTNVLNGNIG